MSLSRSLQDAWGYADAVSRRAESANAARASHERREGLRPANTPDGQSSNVPTSHPDTSLMRGVREALSSNLAATVAPAKAKAPPVAMASAVHSLFSSGLHATDRVERMLLCPQPRSSKVARFPYKPRQLSSPPLSASLARSASPYANTAPPADTHTLGASDLDALEQTLYGHGEIVCKHPPPGYVPYGAFDASPQAVDEPDRFFGELLGKGATPPAELGDVDSTPDDKLQVFGVEGLIGSGAAKVETGEVRLDHLQQALQNDLMCALAGQPTPGRSVRPPTGARRCSPSRAAPKVSRENPTRGAPRPPALHAGATGPGATQTHSDDSLGFLSSHYRQPTYHYEAAERPVQVETDEELSDETIFYGVALARQTLGGDSGLDRVSPVSAEKTSASRMTSPYDSGRSTALDTTTDVDVHEPGISSIFHASLDSGSTGGAVGGPFRGRSGLPGADASPGLGLTSPPCPAPGAVRRPPARLDQAESRAAAPALLAVPARYGELPADVQAKIQALSGKISRMPRRKLRECLANEVTLQEVEPLMVVNRDDLATMLSLGVTTWKSFVHQELGVARWPARGLKSIANKSREARDRLEAAARDGCRGQAGALRLDLFRLGQERELTMEQLRAAARRQRGERTAGGGASSGDSGSSPQRGAGGRAQAHATADGQVSKRRRL
jgi:hypothetical protein